ncbi:MAG: XRE family transcriptional regulator [Deltaproteobacteria bacterium GWC2_65_14]|nr:MAG: XRE family transcriptional regulator [Deltaproteobacteria bacterium GWC2_65_14]
MAGKKREAVVAGTGNVFQDLGLADSEDRKLRVQLAVRLNKLIDEHRLSQAAVAKRFGVSQPHVSNLRNYKLSRFSSERLLRFITLLDRDIDIVIRPRDSAHEIGHVSVLFTV